MTANRKIVLNAGRVHQIERLAQLRETSIAGAVEALVADRVAAGEIPAGFPGFAVERKAEKLHVTLDGRSLSPITVSGAAQFGRDLAYIADKPGRAAGVAGVALISGEKLRVACTGFGFTFSAGDARLTVSRSMLAEIAAQIVEAAR